MPHYQGTDVKRTIVKTNNAPQAIGTYSQAVKAGDTVYLAGQIPLVPETMTLESGDMRAQIRRVFENLGAVAKASGGSLQDVVKLNVFLTDLAHFPLVNEVMAQYFREPYPARAAVGVAALPKGAAVEMDAILILNKPATSSKKSKAGKTSKTKSRR
jgi:reactive intermediate/imine deaminase